MQVRTALLGSLVWLGACGGAAPPPAQPAPAPMVSPAPPPAEPPPPPVIEEPPPLSDTEEAIQKMAAFRDVMCTCTDKQCAEDVTNAITQWSERFAKDPRSSDRITEDYTRRMAPISGEMTKCMTAAITASAHTGAAATSGSPPPHASGAPSDVAAMALDANRIAGETNVVPDDDVKRAFAKSGHPKLVTTYKVCIDLTGNVFELKPIKSSGYASYDAKIQRAIHGWKYRPFRVNGQPAKVCTAVTFIYRQSDPPPPPPKP